MILNLDPSRSLCLYNSSGSSCHQITTCLLTLILLSLSLSGRSSTNSFNFTISICFAKKVTDFNFFPDLQQMKSDFIFYHHKPVRSLSLCCGEMPIILILNIMLYFLGRGIYESLPPLTSLGRLLSQSYISTSSAQPQRQQ